MVLGVAGSIPIETKQFFLSLRVDTLIQRDISPKNNTRMTFFYLFADGFTVHAIQGLCYNPFTRKWSKLDDTSVNYALVARKELTEDENVGNS